MIANFDEIHLINNPYANQLKIYADKVGEPCIIIIGKIQEEISQLDVDSQQEFLSELGLDDLSLNKISRAGYGVLDLITFFTANENEAHAWTVPRDTSVHTAAGKIHTDFEKGFIKAEVIKFDDLIKYGSEAEVKNHGLMAIQGKDYVVQDGDLIFFRFNV